MKVNIDSTEYTVPAEAEILLLQQFREIMLREYAKLDPNIRFLGKPAARAYLQKLENEARVKYGQEQALVFRPEKKKDAVVFLSNIMVGVMREALQHVTISVGTVDHSIANFKLTIEGQSASGGPLAIDGDKRERQDNGIEVP